MVGRADDRPVGDLRAGAVRRLAQDARAVAHPLRGLEEHPAELAAADHAERGRRVEDRERRRSVMSATRPRPSVWSSAERRQRLADRRVASCARIAAASKRGVGRPRRRRWRGCRRGCPSASGRSTGASRPRAGPCSRPARPGPAGSSDAASIPGRCAAPPAPAIMTSSPRPSASRPYSKSRSGVRWAETTRASWGMPSSSRTSTACRSVSQSDRLPITTPTRGDGSAGIDSIVRLMSGDHHGVAYMDRPAFEDRDRSTPRWTRALRTPGRVILSSGLHGS